MSPLLRKFGKLNGTVEKLLKDIFSDCTQAVCVENFTGGHSNTRVYKVQPDIKKAVVVKIGLYDLIQQEWEGYQTIRDYLGRITKVKDEKLWTYKSYAGLVYELAGDIENTLSLQEAMFSLDEEELIQTWMKLLKPFNQMWNKNFSQSIYASWNTLYDDFLPPNITCDYSTEEKLGIPIFPNKIEELLANNQLKPTMQLSLGQFEVAEIDDYEVILNDDVANRSHRKYRIRVNNVPHDLVALGSKVNDFRVSVTSTRNLDLENFAGIIQENTQNSELPEHIKKLRPVQLLQSWLNEDYLYDPTPIHGDLHLRNVVLSESNKDIRIIDFGKTTTGSLFLDLCRLELSLVIDCFAHVTPKYLSLAKFIHDLYFISDGLWHKQIRIEDVPSHFHKSLKIMQLLRDTSEPLAKASHNETKQQIYYRNLLTYLIGSLKFLQKRNEEDKRKADREIAVYAIQTVAYLYENTNAIDFTKLLSKGNVVVASGEAYQDDSESLDKDGATIVVSAESQKEKSDSVEREGKIVIMKDICSETYTKWQIPQNGLPQEIYSEIREQLLNTTLSKQSFRDIMIAQPLNAFSNRINFDSDREGVVLELITKLHNQSAGKAKQNALVAFLCAVIKAQGLYEDPLMDVTLQLEEYIRRQVGD